MEKRNQINKTRVANDKEEINKKIDLNLRKGGNKKKSDKKIILNKICQQARHFSLSRIANDKEEIRKRINMNLRKGRNKEK